MKPTPMLTHSQAVMVAVLKEASPSFVVMRRLAMRFRGLLRSADHRKLGSWLDDARRSGVQYLQQFARTLSRDIEAVRNAIAEPWSSGQAEGQINRLKTSKARHVRPRWYRIVASQNDATQLVTAPQNVTKTLARLHRAADGCGQPFRRPFPTSVCPRRSPVDTPHAP